MPSAADFEKLGVFYLGRPYDLAAEEAAGRAAPLRLEGPGHARRLRRHDRQRQDRPLPRAARRGGDRRHPGDRHRPQGRPRQPAAHLPRAARRRTFAPWVNEDDARARGPRAGRATPRQQAERWKKGLADWGQDGDAHPAAARRGRLRDLHARAATPGMPLSDPQVVRRAAAGDPRRRASCCASASATTATSLLGLARHRRRPDPEPRAHPARRRSSSTPGAQGSDLDLAGADPADPDAAGRQRVGVIDLESFFPAKDRFALAMALNNLLAVAGLRGLDGGRAARRRSAAAHAGGQAARRDLLDRAPRRRRADVLRLAAAQRRCSAGCARSPGTTSLRALLYMDEIFGYFPPVANPPSKTPLLTLLKQARAFGVGVVLATQNPVDLDYKGLVQRRHLVHRPAADRARQGARARRPRRRGGRRRRRRSTAARWSRCSPGLGNRVFLMNNVHEDAPVVFETRWAMSYLRGPLTRAQIKTLMDPRRAAAPRPAPRARPLPPRAVARPPPRRPRAPSGRRASGRSCRPTSLSISSRCVAPRPRDRRSSTGRCSSGRPRSGWPTPRARWT